MVFLEKLKTRSKLVGASCQTLMTFVAQGYVSMLLFVVWIDGSREGESGALAFVGGYTKITKCIFEPWAV